MCRMVGYVGAGIGLRAILDEPVHGLERQSWAPRETQGAVVNADGWGVAWYLSGQSEPCLYRSDRPIWADANRLGLGRTIAAHCLLAAVRSATEPLSHGICNVQPFVHGPLAFSHNGFVKPFRAAVLRRLRSGLCDEAYRAVRGDTDSEHYFALVIDEWLRAEGREQRLQWALERATERLLALAEEAGAVALVAVVVTEGDGDHGRLVAQRRALGGTPPSLYVRPSERGACIASEPLDDLAGWRPVAVGAPQAWGGAAR